MAILDENFYHKTITLYTSVFGTVFNNIQISRDGQKLIKVPLSYADQQKSNVRLEEEPNPDNTRRKMTLPRMYFKLTGWDKDDNRATSRYNRINGVVANPTTDLTRGSQYNRVPYNFNFDLGIKTKFMGDMLEIIEQILVYFNPSIEVVVNDNPDLNLDSNINISLVDSSPQFQYDGEYEQTEVIETTLSFRLEGWLYMPTSDASIIRTINLNYYDLDQQFLIDTDVITEK